MLCNVAVIKTGDSHIEQDIQQKRKVEKGEIQTICFVANKVLYRTVDSEYPKWFDEQIEGKQQNEVSNKLAFQSSF